MFTFLRNYQATPHSTTGQSPAEGLLGRKDEDEATPTGGKEGQI